MMEWVPAERFAALNCADALVNATEPIETCESRKEIVPVGATEPLAGATLVLNVTLLPAVICVAETESDVLVLIFAGAATATETGVEAEGAKFASPE